MKYILGVVGVMAVVVYGYLQYQTEPILETSLAVDTPVVQQLPEISPEEKSAVPIADDTIIKNEQMSKGESVSPVVKQQVSQPSLARLSNSVTTPYPYVELKDPDAYLHTAGRPFTLGEYVGKKIIMVSFMTYSCINCQRTFPHLVEWDARYRDQGLLIVGIHTPEFAFEHDADRVAAELAKYNITFPVVLDSSYNTWRAYQNRYWPRRYIIDIEGNVVYDHIGEGDYAGAEAVIKALLPTVPTV
ncbi:MAG: hypothetical protein RLZZ70_170 [Candidatus Parcubacteria bacterium]|jgi:thiol-disulfide isomerase/thioredoxin